MICVLSPAKTMRSAIDANAFKLICEPSVPIQLDKSNQLAETLKRKSRKELKTLCEVSDNLAGHVESLYKEFVLSNGGDIVMSRSAQAALAFNGPAFQGLKADSLETAQGELLQKHLRILTGLYGAVRPGDMIQEHRLCMSSKLSVDTHKDLYEYWGDSIANDILLDLNNQLDAIEAATGRRPPPLVVNCASQEYARAVLPHLEASGVLVIECVFLDAGKVKSVYAKRARGLMARFVCTLGGLHSGEEAHLLHGFCSEGYNVSATQSTPTRVVFTRASPPSGSTCAGRKQAVVSAKALGESCVGESRTGNGSEAGSVSASTCGTKRVDKTQADTALKKRPGKRTRSRY